MRDPGSRTKDLLDRLPVGIRVGVKKAYYARQVGARRFRSEEPDLTLAEAVLREGDWAFDIAANIGH